MIAGGRGRLNSDIYSDNLRKVRLRGNCAMAVHKKGGALTEKEKSIVKSLLAEGMRNLDILALADIGRDLNDKRCPNH